MTSSIGVDITEEFKNCSSKLDVGELLKASNFGLIDAMSAIELMDPKMDAGLVYAPTNRTIHSINSAVKTGLLSVESMTCADFIAMFDYSISAWLSWLDGQTSLQTVQTNLYLQDPSLCTDPKLASFVQMYLYLIELTDTIVGQANVFEDEEDFQQHYSFAKPNSSICFVKTKDLEESLQKKIRLLKAKGDDTEMDLHLAVLHRIKLLRALVSLIQEVSTSDHPTENYLKSVALARSSISDVVQTSSLGSPFVQRPETKYDYPSPAAFEPLLNLNKLPPTLPRISRMKPASEALPELLSIIKHLDTVSAFFKDLQILPNGWFDLFEFLISFNCAQSNLLVRSITSCSLSHPLWAQELVTQLSVRMLTNVFGVDPAELTSEVMMAALNSNGGLNSLCIKLAQSLCNTQTRLRDQLPHIIEELSFLESHLDVPSVANTHACVSVLVHSIAARYILLGSELELYTPCELHYVFYNLAENLSSALSSWGGADEAAFRRLEKTTKKAKKGKLRRPLQNEMALLRGVHSALIGYCLLWNGLQFAGLVSKMSEEFSSEFLVYETRFVALAKIRRPEVLQYAKYEQVCERITQQCGSSERCYSEAANQFNTARAALEELAQEPKGKGVPRFPALLCFWRPLDASPAEFIQQLTGIFKRNCVIAKILSAGRSCARVHFNFQSNPNFPLLEMS